MNKRCAYALTHPIDEFHMGRMATCRRVRTLPDGVIFTSVLAVDR